MRQAAPYWKDEIDDLKGRASNVLAAADGAPELSPRAAARVLLGVVGLVSRKFSVDEMQRTCAALVRHERAWTTKLGDLPHTNGYVSEPTHLIACVAASLLPLAGANGVRDALSFWATEDDPAVWSSISGAA